MINNKFLYEEIFYDLKGGKEIITFNNGLKQKYKNYDLDKIFNNHEIIDNFNVKFINSLPLETLLYDEIEKIWDQIDKNDDWSLFNQKIDSINKFKIANLNHGLGQT